MFEFMEAKYGNESLQRYVELFSVCFPAAKNLTREYLAWLYRDNPCGRVIGMDAYVEGELAAHYACIPSEIELHGVTVRSLLSLNTATHPKYQGKGLFTKLAGMTYELGLRRGYTVVYGVANANSTPGFVRKLGFQQVGSLEARIGVGRPMAMDWEKVKSGSEFRRCWDSDQLRWRMNNPANPIRAVDADTECHELYAKTDHKSVYAWGAVPRIGNIIPTERQPNLLLPRLFLGICPAGSAFSRLSLSIPDWARPSPLNLIFRSMHDNGSIDSRSVFFSFIDFDAY
jgi:GNAT superfamily N-acetyltransferase